MKLAALLLSLQAFSAVGFVHPNNKIAFRSQPLAVSLIESEVPITVTGKNIDLTEALEDYVSKKLDNIFGKLRSNGSIQDCEVHMSVNKNPKVRSDRYLVVVGVRIVMSPVTPLNFSGRKNSLSPHVAFR